MSGGERPGAPGSFRAGLPLVVLAGLVGMLAGLLWGIADEPRYSATATVVAGSGSGAAEPEDLRRFAEIGSSSEVANVAAGLLGDDVPGADLLSDVTAAAEPDGGAISIVAISTMPDFSVAAANAYAEALVETSAKGRGGKPLDLGAAATIPDGPSENRSGLGWSLAGLLAGLLVGSAVTLLGGRLRRAGHGATVARGRSAGPQRPWLERTLDAPVLATFADPDPLRGPPRAGRPLALDVERIGTYRSVVTKLGLAGGDGPRTLAVVGFAADGDAIGVALGLAAAAAEGDMRVIILETDLAAPSLADRLGVEPEPGLRDYLDRNAGPRDVMRNLSVATSPSNRVSVVCVPAGEPDRTTARIAGRRFDGLIERLPRVYDLVILAAPPLLADPDAMVVAGAVEGVVAVAPEAEFARAEVEGAAKRFRTVPLLGVIGSRGGRG